MVIMPMVIMRMVIMQMVSRARGWGLTLEVVMKLSGRVNGVSMLRDSKSNRKSRLRMNSFLETICKNINLVQYKSKCQPEATMIIEWESIKHLKTAWRHDRAISIAIGVVYGATILADGLFCLADQRASVRETILYNKTLTNLTCTSPIWAE